MKLTKNILRRIIKEEVEGLDHFAATEAESETASDLEVALNEIDQLASHLLGRGSWEPLDRLEKIRHIIEKHRAEMLGL